jgi:hypothetical protein
MKLAATIFAITLSTAAAADSSYTVILQSGAEGALRPADEPMPEPAVEAALFPRLFRQYLKSARDCPATWDALGPSQLDAGAFAPEIVSVLHGFFTVPKIKETLYVVAMNECATMPNQRTFRAIILRNGEIVLNQAYAGTMAANVVNIDGDGIDEWVSVSATCMRDVCVETARIVRVSTGRIVEVKDLGNTYFATCCVHQVNSTEANHVVWTSIVMRDGKFLKVMDTRPCGCL